jgi:hypothetical protein
MVLSAALSLKGFPAWSVGALLKPGPIATMMTRRVTMNPDQLYTVRTLQHADLLAEAEAEARARQAERAPTAGVIARWRRLAAWLLHSVRRLAVDTR